jgi:hypothetical protein
MKRLIKKADENKKDISEIENIVTEWYSDGFNDKSLFHGYFHSIDDKLTPWDNGGGFTFHIDFGSAEKENAIENLKERLKPFRLDCNAETDKVYIIDTYHIYS